MVEQESTQTDLNPARAAVLHHIAQSLAHTADTSSFLREALGELSVLLQLAFAIVTQRERNEIAPLASTSGFVDPTLRLALEATPARWGPNAGAFVDDRGGGEHLAQRPVLRQ